MKKNAFEVFKEMNINDGENNTALLAVSPYLVEAKTAKGGGHVTMGVEANVITQLMTGDRVAMLLVFDKREFDRIDNLSTVDHAKD